MKTNEIKKTHDRNTVQKKIMMERYSHYLDVLR